ncbi:hypothetical protein BGI41_05380 [Methanobrevibacter sp. 87.7]|uniref:Ppx/GppA phosphatase family protein n=1 Tax=Methanobrevibacter sp. 87.7 TaxID=387957 RepID=UPI000B5025F8|nr:phosphatase [Methanobrevibacter sp. 87.7]OWT32871.1 hypothetical protein BGI41_05380 [Methanobrevibacter sp. 87.7]
MLYGIIDIGSNTVRMNVYSYNKKHFSKIFSEKETLGLIAYVDKNNKLPKKAIKKLINVLKNMQKDLEVLHIHDFTAFTTASIRNVDNSDEVVSCVKDEIGMNVIILPSEDEAKFSFIGAKENCHKKDGVVVDSGGGSTEIVIYEDNKVKESYSMPIGSLNLFNEYVSHILPNDEERKLIESRVFEEIEKLNINYDKKIPFMCGVGGTIRAVNNMLSELGMIQKKNCIPVEMLTELEKKLSNGDRSSYDIILHVKPSRIHTIVPGLLIFKVLTKYFKCKEVQVSKFGVREGFFIENVYNKYINE